MLICKLRPPNAISLNRNWCSLGKCSILGLGQEMYNMSLEYLVLAKSKKAIKDYWDYDKRIQPTWITFTDQRWDSLSISRIMVIGKAFDMFKSLSIKWFKNKHKKPKPHWLLLEDFRESRHYSEKWWIREMSFCLAFPIWSTVQLIKLFFINIPINKGRVTSLEWHHFITQINTEGNLDDS